MAYADQQMSGNRIIALIIVALIHVVVGYVLISGLAFEATKKIIERVTTVDIEEPPPEEPKDEPPPPPPDAPPPPVAPPPPINIAPAPPPIRTQPNIPPPAPPALVIAPPPAPPSMARAATPDGQNRWARRIQENYPARALREETEGAVGVSVTVDTSGKVAACRVTRSSGSSILDDAACKGMERYARFNPALDHAGNPTTGNFATSIVYRLN